MGSLSLVHRAGDQAAEAIRARRQVLPEAARRVGIGASRLSLDADPPKMSGGMRRRLACIRAEALA